jgi:hypothetical protein
VLVQCGTPTPTNLGNTTQVYQIPITKAAVMETTVVPYLEVRKKKKKAGFIKKRLTSNNVYHYSLIKMIGAVSSIDYIADGDLICSSCFQKYYTSGNISALSSTNETLQAEQINQVQIQFGYNPYATTTPIDANTTVTTAQSYEPDVLGVSVIEMKLEREREGY